MPMIGKCGHNTRTFAIIPNGQSHHWQGVSFAQGQADHGLGEQPQQSLPLGLDAGEGLLQLGQVTKPLLLTGPADAPVDVGLDLVDVHR